VLGFWWCGRASGDHQKQEIIELDDLLVIEAEHVARQQGKSLSEVVAAALRAYVDANRQPNCVSFIGIGESDGTPRTVEEQNQVLIDGPDPVEGWSPDRSALRRSELAAPQRNVES
jgi:hypothetical protein